MKKYIVHVKRNDGWKLAIVKRATYEEAAIAAVKLICASNRYDFDSVPHDAKLVAVEGVTQVQFTESTSRAVVRRSTIPGELWFAARINRGNTWDCGQCGGTGEYFYDAKLQCYACGEGGHPGRGTGISGSATTSWRSSIAGALAGIVKVRRMKSLTKSTIEAELTI